jgi:CRP-like cAMP-binding protein
MKTQIPKRADLVRAFFEEVPPTRIRRSAHILTPESDTQEVFQIKNGHVKVYERNARGQRYVHLIYGPGDIFPLARLNYGSDNVSKNYQALSDCVVYARSREDVLSRFALSADFSYFLLQEVVNQFELFASRVKNLEHTYATERLAYCLAVLSKRFGKNRGKRIVLDVPLSHQTLADSANITREVVTRELGKFNQRHIVTSEDDRLVILDYPTLCKQFAASGVSAGSL